MGPTNEDLAEWAGSCVEHFKALTNVDHEDALADLLCNLKHYADQQGMDFSHELMRGEEMYAEELAEAPAAGH